MFAQHSCRGLPWSNNHLRGCILEEHLGLITLGRCTHILSPTYHTLNTQVYTLTNSCTRLCSITAQLFFRLKYHAEPFRVWYGSPNQSEVSTSLSSLYSKHMTKRCTEEETFIGFRGLPELSKHVPLISH